MTFGLYTSDANGNTVIDTNSYFEAPLAYGMVAPTSTAYARSYTYLIPNFDPSIHSIMVASYFYSHSFTSVGSSLTLNVGSVTFTAKNAYGVPWQYIIYKYFKKVA